jgi:hypothetical protein
MTMSLSHNASQATQVEQARAVAEVAGAIRAAQDRPRDEDLALARFLSACSRPRFAERAFFRYSRAGTSINGPSIDFAVEAVRCWGNTISGSSELVRRERESEMIAFAWDLETNSQRRTTFVNPHVGYADTPKVDEETGVVRVRRLIASRDVREGNQSVGSRVEREMILAVLPEWYIEEGIARCYATVNGQSDEPIEDQRRKTVAAWEGTGVRREQLEAHLGVAVGAWLPPDLATLRVLWTEIARGERTAAETFPAKRSTAPAAAASVSTADLAGAQADQAPAANTEPVDTEQPAGKGEPGASRSQVDGIFARLGELGYAGRAAADRATRLRLFSIISGETIGSTNELTAAAADHIRSVLAASSADDLAEMLREQDDEDAGAGQ